MLCSMSCGSIWYKRTLGTVMSLDAQFNNVLPNAFLGWRKIQCSRFSQGSTVSDSHSEKCACLPKHTHLQKVYLNLLTGDLPLYIRKNVMSFMSFDDFTEITIQHYHQTHAQILPGFDFNCNLHFIMSQFPILVLASRLCKQAAILFISLYSWLISPNLWGLIEFSCKA